MRLLFDTCFLIDLERELTRAPGRAHAFLRQHAADQPLISWTVVGEFAEGFGDIEVPACRAMLDRFDILESNRNAAGQYARITKFLRESNQIIGTNDLWIAAAALAASVPVVTNNTVHFGRVPGLLVMGY